MAEAVRCARCNEDVAPEDIEEHAAPCGCTNPFCGTCCTKPGDESYLPFPAWLAAYSRLHARVGGRGGSKCPTDWREP